MKKLDIVYEDKQLLVINKPCKLLTISDGKTDNTLYSMARDYVKKKHKQNKIFIVHRLDKDTSGIVVFAKNERIKKQLQDNWNNIVKREYLALIEGKLKDQKGIFKDYLFEDNNHFIHVSNNRKGDLAITEYEIIKYIKNNTLVKINIKTGKKNQIRVSFSNIGHPILGDKKYGSNINKFHRLCLHAYKVSFTLNNQEYKFETKTPIEFRKIDFFVKIW